VPSDELIGDVIYVAADDGAGADPQNIIADALRPISSAESSGT
jgi:hypothetical protein